MSSLPALAYLKYAFIRLSALSRQIPLTCRLQWLSEERLMTRLVRRLSPAHSPDMHVVVTELIKGIISMSAPSPAVGLSEGLQTGLASNRFARELASRENMQILVDFILCDFSDTAPTSPSNNTSEDRGLCLPTTPTIPTYDSATSSVVNSICMVIELIRQNNSDYFEPYLFHTLRNRLIHVQQQLSTHDPEEGRIALEGAMKEMVDRIGVVHLGPLLEIFCDRLHVLKQYLLKPRSSLSLSYIHYLLCNLTS
jgi:serine/threonine-protein phosphatase 6 regulatory subunit 3